MSRDFRLYLLDIQQACDRVLRYARGLTLEEFTKDDMAYDAILRNLEIIGEAAKHIPEDVSHRYKKVEWRRLSGLRDIVAHAYFGVNDEIVWDVVQNKIPDLEEQMKEILGSEGAQPPEKS